jgi:hypothetical protein
MKDKALYEFGNAFAMTGSPTWATDNIKMVEEMAKRDYVGTLEKVLDILTDVEIVQPFKVTEAPATDALHRWKNYGWYVSFRSDQYTTMREHFACKMRHEPHILTKEYVMDLMDRYITQAVWESNE